MGPVYLFDLASRQAEWLSVRQATIAGNVSNANTPGFKAKDVEPFVDVLDRTQLAMASTSHGHLGFGALKSDAVRTTEADTWQTTHSGNSVALEEELMKAGEVSRSFSLNTSVVKAFHRLLMMSVKA